MDLQHLVPGELPLAEPGGEGPGLGGLLRLADALDAPLHGEGPLVELVVAHEGPQVELVRRLLELADLGLLLLVLAELLLVPPLLLDGVEGVVAGVKLRLAVADLDDPADGPVQEVAVVADGHHRALEAADIVLQPLHGVEIQVVGGLVQEKDVRVLQDEAAQVHPGLLPAGEAVEELLPHGLGDAQAVGHLAHGGGGVVAADALKLGGELPVAAEGGLAAVPGGHGGGQGLHLRGQLLVTGEGGVQHVLHCVAHREHGDLGDEPQAAAPGDDHLPLVGLQLPGEDAEEGGLAGAVAAQQPHPLPGLHLEGDAVQYVVSDLKGFFDSVDADVYHGSFSGFYRDGAERTAVGRRPLRG